MAEHDERISKLEEWLKELDARLQCVAKQASRQPPKSHLLADSIRLLADAIRDVLGRDQCELMTLQELADAIRQYGEEHRELYEEVRRFLGTFYEHGCLWPSAVADCIRMLRTRTVECPNMWCNRNPNRPAGCAKEHEEAPDA